MCKGRLFRLMLLVWKVIILEGDYSRSCNSTATQISMHFPPIYSWSVFVAKIFFNCICIYDRGYVYILIFSGLSCHSCNSIYDSRCGDPYDAYTVELVDCEQVMIMMLKMMVVVLCIGYTGQPRKDVNCSGKRKKRFYLGQTTQTC